MKDIALLDKMYELNLTYFKELTMYIIAGKKKLNEVREGTAEGADRKGAAVPWRRTHRRPGIWTPCVSVLKRRFTTWS